MKTRQMTSELGQNVGASESTRLDGQHTSPVTHKIKANDLQPAVFRQQGDAVIPCTADTPCQSHI